MQFNRIKIIFPLLLIIFLGSCDLFGNLFDNTADWTIIAYIDGDNNLEYPLYGDINEMEAAIKSDSLNILVLADRIDSYWAGDGDWTDTRAFELGNDDEGFNYTLSSHTKRLKVPSLGLTTDSETELDMGNPDTLSTWVQFCMKNYPAENYMLIMSDHGDGWTGNTQILSRQSKGICWDDSSDNSFISMGEMRTAIESVIAAAEKPDIIYFDTCLTGMVENLAELSEVCDFLIFSEDNVPSKGAPYYSIFNELDTAITPVDLSSRVVDYYDTAWASGEMVDSGFPATDYTLTAVATSGTSDFLAALSSLADTLIKSPPSGDLRNQVELMNLSGYPEHIDLYDYCRLLSPLSEAEAVRNQIESLTVNFKGGSDHPHAGGLAIYYPPHSTLTLSSYYNDSRMEFVRLVPEWKQFLENRDQQSLTDNLEQYGNDTIEEAYYNTSSQIKLSSGQKVESYISFSGDSDWYTIPDMKSGSVALTVPDGFDFNMEMYGINESSSYYYLINENSSAYNLSGSLNEKISLDISQYSYDVYLVKIYGRSSSDYSLDSNYVLLYSAE